jgi:5-formyltetrahydrofolate cyclo-ligase
VDFPGNDHGGPVTHHPEQTSPVNSKADLRKALRKARSEHVAALPVAVSRLVFNRPPVPVVEMLEPYPVVGVYLAVGNEAPTLGWIRFLHENGWRVVLPWFAGRDAPMAFREWTNPWNEDLLEPAPWGGLQPRSHADELEPQALVVPLVGFTDRLERLGQGGGHYDRWLAAHPGTPTIGLAWDVQQVDSLPCEDHDHPLTAVVTPTRIHGIEA